MGEQSGRKPKGPDSLVRYIALVLLVLLSLLGQSVVFATEGTITSTVRINPLLVSVSSAPDTVSQGDEFTVTADIQNRGETRLLQAKATLNLPEGLTVVRRLAERHLGVIKPQATKTVDWLVSADESGTFVIQVSVSAKEQKTGTLLSDEGSITLKVK